MIEMSVVHVLTSSLSALLMLREQTSETVQGA